MRCVAKLTNQRRVLMKNTQIFRLRKNNIAEKTEENSLRIFLGFSRDILITKRRLNYRLSISVV